MQKVFSVILAFLMAIAIFILAISPLNTIVFAGRALPGTTLNRQDIAGMSHANFANILKAQEEDFLQKKVNLSLADQSHDIPLKDLGVTFDIPATIDSQKHVNNIRPILAIDELAAQVKFKELFGTAINAPVNAALTLTSSGKIQTTLSQTGDIVDTTELLKSLEHNSHSPINLTLISSAPEIIDTEVTAARTQAENIIKQGLALTYGDNEYAVKTFALSRILEFHAASSSGNLLLTLGINEEETQSYLEKTLSPIIDQEAQNARFERAGSGRVTQFALPQTGQELNIPDTIMRIRSAVLTSQPKAALSVIETQPAVADTTDIQNLGLTSLLATGTSDYAGSPANRRHNIAVGTQKYHGLLVEPGQEFSFNEFLGPVNAAAGYKPELVIKNKQTIPEYGGGLCQVSTTAFRAAVHAGLEITDRRSHAYAVSYYGQPGFDATIYPPYTDLKFTNNTPGYILIQTRIEGTNLTFDFWGTDDGRQVKVSDITNYDKQDNGAIKARFDQTVTSASGETIIEETFYSRYKSPDLYPKTDSLDAPPPETPAST